MTRGNVIASVLYREAINLKKQDFNKLVRKGHRKNLISSLSAMQFLTGCLALKHISLVQAESMISTLQNIYHFDTEEFSKRLREASDESDFSVEYDELIFQMHSILSACIHEIIQKKKGYTITVDRDIKAFHNLPRAFLSITDRSKISPADAIEYATSYMRLD